MLNGLGMMLLLFGMMIADSDSLVYPTVLAIIGSLMIIVGRRQNDENK